MGSWDERLSSLRILHCIVARVDLNRVFAKLKTERLFLKVAFLIGRDDAATHAAIARVCLLPGIETAAVLLDTGRTTGSQRWRNLKRNIRREGLSYIFFRAVSALRQKLEKHADDVIPNGEVEQLLNAAFPEGSLAGLGSRYGFSVIEAGNLNAGLAVEQLRRSDADLGIVLGTRILKRDLFSIPRMGCINLHKGKVPDYRGQPPGFWELYEGQNTAGVTVHFVDDGLDTGDVVGASEVVIHPMETPDSLRRKLDVEGADLLAKVVEEIERGTHVRIPQAKTAGRARTRPARRQTQELARRLPHWRRLGDGRQAIKLATWLALYYGGVYSFLRWWRRKTSRGAILLYHRVNDISEDVLTVSTRRFAQHLVTLRRHYRVIASEQLVERVAAHECLEESTVAIHFDDCYRDVRTNASPLLAAARMPATFFISSGFVDTTRVFEHDELSSPHRFENLCTQDVREIPGLGVSVAAHTVTHADLGSVDEKQALTEVIECGKQLEQIVSRPVLLFSFPFGGIQNIRQEIRQMVMTAGYRALFSAHGGFLDKNTSVFDIPRFGVNSDHSPLALMMELEGISQQQFKGWRRRRAAAVTKG